MLVNVLTWTLLVFCFENKCTLIQDEVFQLIFGSWYKDLKTTSNSIIFKINIFWNYSDNKMVNRSRNLSSKPQRKNSETIKSESYLAMIKKNTKIQVLQAQCGWLQGKWIWKQIQLILLTNSMNLSQHHFITVFQSFPFRLTLKMDEKRLN